MADSTGCSISPSSLFCSENRSCLYENQIEEEDEEMEQKLDFFDGYDDDGSRDEYIQMLMIRERNLSSGESHGRDFYDSLGQNWLRSAHLGAVQWILKMRAIFGFSFQTAYLSVTYLDRFLLLREIDKGKSWAIQLLSMACLSIAVKMEECKVPSLSEFLADDYCFDWRSIRRMELLVLATLDWRMNCITPFSYLGYFWTKFGNGSQTALSKAAGLILETTKVLNLMKYRPSGIAAAAVLISSNQRLKNQEHLIASCECLEYEDVLKCYNQILELEKRRVPQVTTSLDISEIYASSEDAFDAALPATSLRRKRRKLEQDLCDCPISNQQQIL